MTERIIFPTPEQREMLLKAIQEELFKEPGEEAEKSEISRGEFMTRLNARRKQLIDEWSEAQEAVDEAQAGLMRCSLLENQVFQLENNGFCVRFYEKGNEILFEGEEKEPMGFLHERKRS